MQYLTRFWSNGAGCLTLCTQVIEGLVASQGVNGVANPDLINSNSFAGYTKLVERSGSILQMNEDMDVSPKFTTCLLCLTCMSSRPPRPSQNFRKHVKKPIPHRPYRYFSLSDYATLLHRSCYAYLALMILGFKLHISGLIGHQKRQNID